MLVTFTGGEPTLRRDLEDLVAEVDRAISLKYITLITHGAMLTMERAQSLWDAGVNQFNISLDYLDERHDRAARHSRTRRERFCASFRRCATHGIDDMRFNTVIKNDNLDQIMPIVRRAAALGVGRELQRVHRLEERQPRFPHRRRTRSRRSRTSFAELLAFKRRNRGVITNSDYYLEQIPRYLRGEMTEPCHSGIRTIHIDPTGHVKRCPDFPTDFHWRDFKRYKPVDCNACYYACRGEAQAPLRLSRVAT